MVLGIEHRSASHQANTLPAVLVLQPHRHAIKERGNKRCERRQFPWREEESLGQRDWSVEEGS